MASPYDDWKLIEINGTGNFTGTLDSGGDEVTLGEGAWEVWATQNFYCQINAAASAGFGAAPVAVIASTLKQFAIPKTMYFNIKRVSTDGTYYINKVSGPI
ncbi:MAG: hypothetical protein ACYTBJ_01200 [Planctomycetota bacterium]|jgi:hypothetical protein